MVLIALNHTCHIVCRFCRRSATCRVSMCRCRVPLIRGGGTTHGVNFALSVSMNHNVSIAPEVRRIHGVSMTRDVSTTRDISTTRVMSAVCAVSASRDFIMASAVCVCVQLAMLLSGTLFRRRNIGGGNRSPLGGTVPRERLVLGDYLACLMTALQLQLACNGLACDGIPASNKVVGTQHLLTETRDLTLAVVAGSATLACAVIQIWVVVADIATGSWHCYALHQVLRY